MSCYNVGRNIHKSLSRVIGRLLYRVVASSLRCLALAEEVLALHIQVLAKLVVRHLGSGQHPL